MGSEIVCWNGDGPVPEQFQRMQERGEFDCTGCTTQVHIHAQDVMVLEGGITAMGFDVMVGHPHDCPMAKIEQRRAAGQAGLN